MTIRRFVLTALITCASVAVSTPAQAAPSPLAGVWVEPSAGYGFLDAAVRSATHSVALSMYEIIDPTMEQSLAAAAARGVPVRVLIDTKYESSRNAPAVSFLSTHHVHVYWAPSSQIFHAKYLVIDSDRAYIGTGNFVAYDYPSTRDFWVEDTTSSDVGAMLATFNSDVAGASINATSNGLVWSPGSEPAISGFIASAKHTLLVENEEMYSYDIDDALVAAAQRGVNVTVVMTYSSKYVKDLGIITAGGVHVRLMSSGQTYIHAKAMCADCVGSSGTAFVGSINFSTSSLTYNRELGVVTTTPAVVATVRSTISADAAAASAYH